MSEITQQTTIPNLTVNAEEKGLWETVLLSPKTISQAANEANVTKKLKI
jgi:hypothetical protein